MVSAIENDMCCVSVPSGSLQEISSVRTAIVHSTRRLRRERIEERKGFRSKEPQGLFGESAREIFKVRAFEENRTVRKRVCIGAVMLGCEGESAPAIVVPDQRQSSVGSCDVCKKLDHLAKSGP